VVFLCMQDSHVFVGNAIHMDTLQKPACRLVVETAAVWDILGKDCQEAKRCDLCNAADHLARNCPKTKPYAAALKGNMAPPREHVEDNIQTNGKATTITDLRDAELLISDIC